MGNLDFNIFAIFILLIMSKNALMNSANDY